MPVYQFECVFGHVSDDLVALETAEIARNAGVDLAIKCPECAKLGMSEYAHKVLSATKTNFRHNDRRAFK
jgi:hypothetical protein